MTNPVPQSPNDDPVPKYTASGRPVTWGERFAMRIWVFCVFATLTGTLIFYLIDKIFLAK